jgi:hypothetical protein
MLERPGGKEFVLLAAICRIKAPIRPKTKGMWGKAVVFHSHYQPQVEMRRRKGCQRWPVA